MRITKQVLRKELLAKRSAIPQDEKLAWDQAICEALSGILKEYENILAFYPIGSEPDILPALKRAKAEIYLPKCDTAAGAMRFYKANWETLTPGAHNIPEPNSEFGIRNSELCEALCLVPGIAFDFQGYRLGYGKGYYDRFLARGGIETLGICYEALLLDALPRDAHDVPVRRICTEKRSRTTTEDQA